MSTQSFREYRKIKNLYPSPLNKRAVNVKDYDRLKKQIKELGEYKPLVIEDNGAILGGRTRYFIYKETNKQEAWVSVVEPKDDTERLKYILSDNDNVGFWVEDELAELISGEEGIDLKDYKIDIGDPMALGDFMKHYGPPEEKELEDVVDENEKKGHNIITCPQCKFKIKV